MATSENPFDSRGLNLPDSEYGLISMMTMRVSHVGDHFAGLISCPSYDVAFSGIPATPYSPCIATYHPQMAFLEPSHDLLQSSATVMMDGRRFQSVFSDRTPSITPELTFFATPRPAGGISVRVCYLRTPTWCWGDLGSWREDPWRQSPLTDSIRLRFPRRAKLQFDHHFPLVLQTLGSTM